MNATGPWLKAALLLAVLAIGVVLRVHDYATWQDNQALHFFDGEPLLLSADGYQYLRLARDLRDGAYRPIDELRTTPEHPPRPMPPPLLSVSTLALSGLSTLSLPWAAAILPVLLSLCLVLPVLVLFRLLRLTVAPSAMCFAGLVAALAAIASRPFVDRTSLGFYDTDCLIVFFSLSASVLALGFGQCQNRRRYWYLLGAAANAGLFAWWWDQAPEGVALICLAPLLLSIALLYRPSRQEGLVFGVSASALAIAGLAMMPESLANSLQGARDVLLHGVKGATEGFPDVSATIVELQAVTGPALIRERPAFSFVALLALPGLLWLVWKKPRHAGVVLTVPLLLALGVFLFGERLLIFWAPVVGIGLGCVVVAATLRFGSRRSWPEISAAGVAALVAVAPTAALEFSESSPAPRITTAVPAISSIRAHTPENAVIWTSWSFGYPIMYFTGRRTIADGQWMGGERRVYINLPLASRDANFARRFMRFHIARGVAGQRAVQAASGSAGAGLRWLKEHLGGDPEQAARELFELSAGKQAACESADACRQFLFPGDVAPIYLLLSGDMLRSKWFWYGTWDSTRGSGEASVTLPLYGIRRAGQDGNTLLLLDDLTFDVRNGTEMQLEVSGQVFKQPVRKMIVYDGRRLRETDYGHAQGFHLEWMSQNGFGVVVTANVAESLFNRLFIRHTSNVALFRYVEARAPAYSIWEVVADS